MKEKYDEDFKVIEKDENGTYTLSLASGTSYADEFSVFVRETGEIEDYYVYIQLQEPLTEYVTENTKQFAGDGKFVWIIQLRSTEYDEVPERFDNMEHSIGA